MQALKFILNRAITTTGLILATSCGYLPPEIAEIFDPANNPDHRLDLTEEQKIIELYQAMKDVHEVFTACNVPYFIDSGTLLGAVRNGGIIPWDDDHDLGVLEHDIPRVKILQDLFKEFGYQYNDVFFGYKIVRQAGYQPTVDIFKMRESNGKIGYAHGSWGKRDIVIDSITKEKQRVDIFITRNELYPFKDIQFGPLTVRGPQNPNPYLDAYYRGWPTVAFTYGHSGQRKFKVDLEKFPEYKKPAPIHIDMNEVKAKLTDRIPRNLECPELKRGNGTHIEHFYNGVW